MTGALAYYAMPNLVVKIDTFTIFTIYRTSINNEIRNDFLLLSHGLLGLVDVKKEGDYDNSPLIITLKDQFRWCLGSRLRELRQGFSLTRKPRKRPQTDKKSSNQRDNVESNSTKRKEMSGLVIKDDFLSQFWSIYNTLENRETHTVSESSFKQSLISSGLFTASEAAQAIKEAIDQGQLKRIEYDVLVNNSPQKILGFDEKMSGFSVQNQASERETSEKTCITNPDFSLRLSGVESNQVSPIALDLETKVREGLEFILGHFSQPLFPRNILRGGGRKGQFEVDSKEMAMFEFHAALWEDCRIAAFRIGQTNPDLIFIELDDKDFCSPRAIKIALTKTLKNIKDKLGGFPTVYRSGRGYHVIQPIDSQVDLSQIADFAALTKDPNTDFIRFAESYLSNGKCDGGNNPALRSCLLRVPGSLNSRCKAEGIDDAEVKILQKWDGYRPDYGLLIGSFYAYLIGRNQERYRASMRQNNSDLRRKIFSPDQDYGPNDWIERLLQTPIDDYRKRARDVILIPYLVIRRGMTDETKIIDIVMQWADKCAELRRLDPSRREFERRTQSRIREVTLPPMRLETLKEKNPGLHEKLNSVGSRRWIN